MHVLRSATLAAVATLLLLPPASAEEAAAPATPAQPAAAQTTPAAPEPTAFQRALTAYGQGDLATATSQLETYTAANADNADAMGWLGFLYLKQNQAERAVTTLEKAVALKEKAGPRQEKDADTYINLGNALLQQNNNARAIEVLREATQLAPNSSEAHINLGLAYSRAKQYSQAAQSYTRATQIGTQDASVYTSLGYALEQSGKPAEAAAAYRQGAQMDPANATPAKNRYNLLLSQAQGHQRANRFAEAAAAFGEAGDLASGNAKPTAYYNQGVMLSRAGRQNEAAAAYRKALAANPRYYDALVNLGFVYYRTNRAKDAVGHFRTAVHVAGSPASRALANANLGAALARSGDRAGAAAAWRRAAALDKNDYESRSLLAGYMLDQRKTAEAIRLYREVAHIRPRSAPAMNGLGLAYQQAGSFDAAATAFKRAIALDPRYSYAHNNLGVVYEKRGQLREAMVQYRRALNVDPSMADARRNLARFNRQRAAR
uniref:Uncharacterized protein n=1 Tax=uncultured Armatimonadetes bacterium TaxID=157466 RepID=A0A6J4IYC4_9BACT|nr:hypothetical protein AVDCRST_MAG63-2640 [uncultured Armatimonadetes bacterium]